jgi:hypothetical protein
VEKLVVYHPGGCLVQDLGHPRHIRPSRVDFVHPGLTRPFSSPPHPGESIVTNREACILKC